MAMIINCARYFSSSFLFPLPKLTDIFVNTPIPISNSKDMNIVIIGMVILS